MTTALLELHIHCGTIYWCEAVPAIPLATARCVDAFVHGHLPGLVREYSRLVVL
jgi:hypothetical protein